ncbi:MAG: pseudouridine synthase [Gammaproteobacteria bacterium]|nr:MAG: pseudouridine synthase [Gammaproteobacteria bacterium]
MSSLLLFNKPYGVISQFSAGSSGDKDRPTLAHYIKLPNVYPAGRLDHDSEGLLLLTDDGQVQHHIAHPAHKLPKTYWVQVEGAPNSYALTKLRQGVELNDGITLPAEARLIPTPKLWERDPPIRSRINIPTQWIEIIITEGKNRQIRRMTAAVGHPTLRLVRVKIGNWTLEGIAPGEYKATTINLPKSALADMPRGRSNRPQNQDRKPGRTGDRPKQDDQQRPQRAASNSDKSAKPTHRKTNTSGATDISAKPSVATKVIIKPSRGKPSE